MATNRDAEYLRRMRALGYEPSLAGMDDEDIEYELARMDWGRAAERPTAPQLNPTYRPVDPGLAARIFRQMGRPYDPSAIDPREAVYIGGWDNGEDEAAKRPAGPLVSQDGARGPEPYDPWANVWKLDWGKEGSPAQAPRTMEWRWGREEPGLVSRGGVRNALGYGLGGADAASGMRELSYNYTEAGGGGEGGRVSRANPKISRELVKEGTEGAKEVIKLSKFGDKAYKVAKDQNHSHEEAMEIAKEAQVMYSAYKLADWGINARLLKKPKTWPAYGVKEGAEEIYDDEIHDYIIRSAINNYKLGKNPPEGSILPP